MSDCDDQQKKKKKKPTDDESTIDADEPIGDWQLITTVAATVVGIFFGLRALGIGQYGALLTSTSLVWFDAALYDD